MMRHLLATTTLFVALAGASFAQAPTTTTHSVATTSVTTSGLTAKQAASKACSDQADAKGLHGKDRKKFRSSCKHETSKT